jgi:cell wall-associated NlpC family hydrolase
MLTLGLLVLVACGATAQQPYKVREGDTISGIAARFGVTWNEIASASGLQDKDRLRINQVLTIPGRSAQPQAAPASSGAYRVRNGENDWTIARRFGISASKLRQMNPGVNWRNLQIGTALNVPGSTGARAVAATAPRRTQTGGGQHTVRNGENDWTIAGKYGIRPSELRAMNPRVRWDRLQIGQTLSVPGRSSQVAQIRIRSRYAVVTGDSVALRRNPRSDAELVTRIGAGTKARVLARQDGWYRLKFPRGTEAWVRGDYLRAVSAPATPPAQVAANRAATPRRVASSSRPPRTPRRSKSTSVVAYAAPTGNLTGKTERLLSKANSMRGVRYRFGGMSRSGTDCSGFTTQVFRSQGIRLPRTSREQATVGRPAKGGLKPGDLVFFKTNRSRRINHVGIYVGSGKFIHASSGGGRVQVNSLNDGYYRRRFATARRVVQLPKRAAQTAKAARPAPKASVAEAAPVSPPSEPPIATPPSEPTGE